MSGARFNDLVGYLRQVFAELPDRRKGKNLSYSMGDFASSAFSVFFTQSPSFLAHQKAMQAARGRNNAQTSVNGPNELRKRRRFKSRKVGGLDPQGG